MCMSKGMNIYASTEWDIIHVEGIRAALYQRELSGRVYNLFIKTCTLY